MLDTDWLSLSVDPSAFKRGSRASFGVSHSEGNPVQSVHFSERVVALKVELPSSGQNNGFEEKKEVI